MTTIREQIAVAVLATLVARLPGVTVFRNLDRSFEPEDGTALNIIDGGHSAPDDSHFGLKKYAMDLSIEGTVTVPTATADPTGRNPGAAVGAARNALYGQVHDAMLADHTFGGLAVDTHEGDMQVATDEGQGRAPNGAFLVGFTIDYFTTPFSASTLGPS